MRPRVIALLALLFWSGPGLAAAHDIPAAVTLRAFAKPEAARLRYLVRIPMASIADIEWPLRKEDGTLELDRIDRALQDAATLWVRDNTEMFENGTKLAAPTLTAVRLSLEGDAAFDSYDTALAHMDDPALTDTRLLPTQGMLDVLLDYPIASGSAGASTFSVHPMFDRLGLRVTTILRFLPPGGAVRTFEYEGGDPGLVRLDPRWHQAAWQFAQMGFFHLLDASDVLLLLFCLALPLRRGLGLAVAAFAAGQTLTLLASMSGLAPGAAWLPPLIATAVATSIVLVALQNVLQALQVSNASAAVAAPPVTAVSYGTGLIAGLGMAFALRDTLQFAGTHAGLSAFSFGVGVVAGEVVTVLLLALALELTFQFVVERRMGTIVLSAIAAHAGWHWMANRYVEFRRFPLGWPSFDALFWIEAVQWTMVAVLVAAAVWLFGVLQPLIARRDPATR